MLLHTDCLIAICNGNKYLNYGVSNASYIVVMIIIIHGNLLL